MECGARYHGACLLIGMGLPAAADTEGKRKTWFRQGPGSLVLVVSAAAVVAAGVVVNVFDDRPAQTLPENTNTNPIKIRLIRVIFFHVSPPWLVADARLAGV
jgi:hypothetical protein